MKNVLSIVSAKGGVGKSTIAANIAAGLCELGHPVLAIDLDPQNALRFHFSFDSGRTPGLVAADEHNFAQLFEPTNLGVELLSYGNSSEQQRMDFEDLLKRNPNWLKEQLTKLQLPDDAVVVLDTPPGPSVYMSQALLTSSLSLVVVLPDAGSYVSLPQMMSLLEKYCLHRQDFIDYGIIVNQSDQSKTLSKDVLSMLRSSFGERIVGRIHLDQSISESLACGQTALKYAPYSEGSYDLMACAKWVHQRCHGVGGRP